MIKKDLLIPALIGLGLYAQTNDISLCNNTTMLLLLFVLLEGTGIFGGLGSGVEADDVVAFRSGRRYQRNLDEDLLYGTGRNAGCGCNNQRVYY